MDRRRKIGNEVRKIGNQTRKAVRKIGNGTRKVFKYGKEKFNNFRSHGKQSKATIKNVLEDRKEMNRRKKKYIFFLKKISNFIDYYKGLYCSVKFFNNTIICNRLNRIMKENMNENIIYEKKKEKLFSEIEKIRKVIIQQYPEHENAIEQDIKELQTDIEETEELFDKIENYDELIKLDSIIHESLDKEVELKKIEVELKQNNNIEQKNELEKKKEELEGQLKTLKQKTQQKVKENGNRTKN